MRGINPTEQYRDMRIYHKLCNEDCFRWKEAFQRRFWAYEMSNIFSFKFQLNLKQTII